jgi:hypothetical protein
MPVKHIPKVLLGAVIGTALFMSVMPDSIKGMPQWFFYSVFATAILAGWILATAIIKVFLWLLNRN